ncbi:Mus7/MMS22 family-domain-containing protein [Russula vinacea]|nr:Mus7/MMS22 family-domain-containing protein [Russula vinacea]
MAIGKSEVTMFVLMQALCNIADVPRESNTAAGLHVLIAKFSAQRSVACACLAYHVAGVTETCACDSRFYALCRCLAMPWPPRSLYPQSTLNMDAQLDAASTSDADERDLLEAANFDLYWDRVITRSHSNSQRCTSRKRWKSAHVRDAHSSSSSQHPGLHASSSPAERGSFCRTTSENLTTLGLTGCELPTTPPTSPHLATSPVAYDGNASMSSPDPLLQFSSPRMRHADADNPNSCPTDHSATGSGPGAGPSTSPSLSIRLPSHEVRVAHSSFPPCPMLLLYSMRTRQPRQLKPYAFDRLEYKYQLKHHPDAIVKFNGRPVESSSRSSEASLGRCSMLPHAKGKKRHRAGTGHPSAPPPVAHRRTSGVQLSLGSPSRDRRFTGTSANAELTLVASIPDGGGNGNPAEAATWYPDAFNDLSSRVGSDDMPLSTDQHYMRQSHTPPLRVKRRRQALRRELPHFVDASSDSSSSGSESMQGSDDDVVLLSEASAIMLIDDHPPSLPPKLELITDFFARGPSEKKKRPRNRGIVANEKTGRSKHALGRVRVTDPQSVVLRNSKARARRRQERPQRPPDLSVFTVAGGRIMSGWQRRNAVTIDTEDLAFRRALEPSARRARQPPPKRLLPSEVPRVGRPPGQAFRGPINRTTSSSTLRVMDPAPDETRHRIVVDFDISSLPPGKVYAASSYLGKGWLFELLSIVSGTPLFYPPPAIEVDGHRLSSVSTALDYTAFLPYACDSFARVLNYPLESSYENFTNWNATMHSVCSLVSWILTSAEGNDAHLIRTASLEYTGSLVARIDTALEDSGDRVKSLCSTIFCLHWFAVELLVRACWSATGSDEDLSTAVSARVVGMANRLLQVGSPGTVLHVITNQESLDGFSLYSCVAELWICLIHLGTLRERAPEAHGEGGLQASEDLWSTLFGLCALSQFSAHGVSTSSARMELDNGLSTRSLRRRDAYIRLIVSRCLILHQRWSWRLDPDDDASAALFRSRKFADLRGEIAGFAAFLQENNATLLAAHASTDSAFTIFLKLIFASAQQMRPSLREDEYLGRTKKLLSLVTPVGSVQHQLSAIRSPFDEQLSMLYNRFSSLALAIRVLPSAENILYRVSLARRYALDMALPVVPALEWTSEIAQVLIAEFRAAVVVKDTVAAARANDAHDARARRTELVQCIQLLLSGFPTCKDTSTALELLQKGCFFAVLVEANLCAIPTIQTLLQGIVDVHLNHALSLQEGQEPPQQEQHLKPNKEESQDEYGQFDLNWDDPMVLAALNNAVEPAPVAVPVPTTMQYTYQSLVEHIKNAVASPTMFENIINAFENQRRHEERLRTGAESA